MKNIRDIKIDLPKYPKLILDTLHENKYKAYIVGGCVRDAVLLKAPSDYDITTSALPYDTKKLFKRTVDTGIKHGTITVVFYENDKPYTYEVTTFRKDGDYEDMRHPKDVTFVSDLSEDLLRRDFTVNAMAYNEEEGLIDIFGGLLDLEKKLIRAVGNPVDRFKEDALRLLRAVRFAAKLGFCIEDETKDAIPGLAKNLEAVSKERVQVELTKTITSDNPEYIKLVYELGLAPYICANFDKVKIGKFDKGLSTHLAYACLFYNEKAETIKEMLKNLKLDNSNIDKVLMLIASKKYLDDFKKLYYQKDFAELSVIYKELVSEIGFTLTYDFLRLIEINENARYITYLRELLDKYKEDKIPIFLSDLSINGNDLMKLDLKGQEIGLALYYLLRIVHKDKKFNTKKALQDIVKKAYNIRKEVKYGL